MSYLPINQHGLIGDLHTAALVGCDGRVVWLPWPRFDSPSLFAALLDAANGGDWLLAPAAITASEQEYDGETAIVRTRFTTATGQAELEDWMPPWDGDAPEHDLYRVLRCTAGTLAVHGRFAPRPDYARQPVALNADDNGLRFEAHELPFHLESSHPWQVHGDSATLHVNLQAGESIVCVLRSGPPGIPTDAATARERTARFWQEWIGRCTYAGPWQAAVRRSAITLKLLVYAPSGAIVAAPTTSLPEWIGGVRNWDYRYTWLRDASLTLLAFYQLGYHAEAYHFFAWLGAQAQRHGTPLRLMYGIGGELELAEQTLDHLDGYRESRPVRIGNGAFDQRQLDIYGPVVGAAYLYEQQGDLLTPAQWQTLHDEVNYVCDHWQEPDHGIWEIRGPMQQHTYSRLMCWVALDRGIRIADHEGWPYERERWHQVRAAIHADILAQAWHEEVQAFTMSYESAELDASLLTMALVGFLPPDDPRMVATVEQIDQQLGRGPLVYRYRTDDHLPGDEGAFLLCSFWMVEALARMGRLEEAEQRFRQLLDYASPHGLLAEEVDPADGTALGNYPQAFSHIGLVNSAFTLLRARHNQAAPISTNV
ncbi:MAG: glycoside hydrolase family 15 protein [Chloroflexaceae bacterium]|jgi:GH15 family glucan-1,4-alpha-glucosidase|nr:glycoside hydrolase family 15 protein [Chloroflexaceae bacterium]